MRLLVDCPGCGKELNIDAKYSGTHGKCNYCGERLLVPTPLLLSAIDLTTTGKLPSKCEIIRVGIRFHPKTGTVIDVFEEIVSPEKRVPDYVKRNSGISEEMLDSARTIRKVIPDFLGWLSQSNAVIGFAAELQKRFLQRGLTNCDGVTCEKAFLDLEGWAATLESGPNEPTLEAWATYLGLSIPYPARSIDYARVTQRLAEHVIANSNNFEADIKEHVVKNIPLAPPAWRQENATLGQLRYLESLGLDIRALPYGLSKGQASDLITHILEEGLET